jgi:hypothetical protein
MSERGQLFSQINAAADLFHSLGMLQERNEHAKYPHDLPRAARLAASYVEEFDLYQKNRHWDVQLNDFAILQFRQPDDDTVGYCYHQAPKSAPTYVEFVSEQMGESFVGAEEIDGSYWPDYELAVDTARPRETITSIRYDYSPKLYEEGVHPAAHVHVGRKNDIRIATRRLMTPIAFALFIIRQMYAEQWRVFLRRNDAEETCAAVRRKLALVQSDYHQTKDRWQLILE